MALPLPPGMIAALPVDNEVWVRTVIMSSLDRATVISRWRLWRRG